MTRTFRPSIIITAMAGLLISITIARLVVMEERENAQLEFKNIMLEHKDSLIRYLELDIETLILLKGLFKASQVVTFEEFSIFTLPVIEQYKSIKLLEWVPRILNDERSDFEKKIKKRGFPNFQIRQKKKGKLVRAEKQKEYFPSTYIEPFELNKNRFGFDIASNPLQLETLIKSRDSGKLLATAPIRLSEGNDKENGILVFLPYYSGNPKKLKQRREQLLGFMLGIFKVSYIFKKSFLGINQRASEINMALYDISNAKKELLHQHHSALDGKEVPSISYREEIEVAGRKWLLTAVATTEYMNSRHTHLPEILFFSGLFLSAVFTLYLRSILNKESEIEAVVNKRTKDLSLFKNLINQTSDSIFLIEPGSAKFIDINEHAYESLGYSREELLSLEIHEIDESLPDKKAWLRFVADMYLEDSNTVDTTLKCRDGKTIQVEVKAKRIVIVGNEYIVSTARDITKRVADKKNLLKRNRRIQMLQDVTSAAFLANDTDSAIKTSIDKVCNYTEWVIGHVYFVGESTLLEPSDLWCLPKSSYFASFKEMTMKRSFAKGEGLSGRVWEREKPVWIEDINRDPNFSKRKILDGIRVKSCFGFPLFVNNRLIAVLEFFSDKTIPVDKDLMHIISHLANQLGLAIERKESEIALIKAKEKAEEANRLKSDFLNTMSHELRTPLTIVLGNVELLLSIDELPDDPQEIVEVAEDIESSGKHLLSLINDLLDLSKIEAGKLKLNREHISAKVIVENSIDSIQRLATQKNISLVSEVEEPLELLADPLRIKQILFNLLSNSVKFTDSGDIKVTAKASKGYALFSVEDSGCGMDYESQKFIFEPFRQVDGSITRKVGGSGLGLAITRKLTELHGGTLGVKSKLKEGSTFTFSIPINGNNLS